MTMNPVVHFEMPAEDMERMKKFYSTAFGWGMHQLGEDMAGYVTVMTSETGPDNFPKKPGTINGGFYNKNLSESKHPSVVIAVDDINVAVEKVTEAGGKIQGHPVMIPGVGQYVSFIDTEGNLASMLEPLPMMGEVK